MALENRALRQQVAIPRRQVKKPTLTLAERLFWVGLMRTWDGWKDSLILVQSETVIRPGTAASGVYVLFDIDPPQRQAELLGQAAPRSWHPQVFGS